MLSPGSYAQQAAKDSNITANIVAADTIETDEIIDEIVSTKKAPSKDKVQYFSQLTRYGFKNLFSKYQYNPTPVSYTHLDVYKRQVIKYV